MLDRNFISMKCLSFAFNRFFPYRLNEYFVRYEHCIIRKGNKSLQKLSQDSMLKHVLHSLMPEASK